MHSKYQAFSTEVYVSYLLFSIISKVVVVVFIVVFIVVSPTLLTEHTANTTDSISCWEIP